MPWDVELTVSGLSRAVSCRRTRLRSPAPIASPSAIRWYETVGGTNLSVSLQDGTIRQLLEDTRSAHNPLPSNRVRIIGIDCATDDAKVESRGRLRLLRGYGSWMPRRAPPAECVLDRVQSSKCRFGEITAASALPKG